MDTSKESSPSARPSAAGNKLSRISDGSKIRKRPLTRQQLPASSRSSVIYVSSKTPFMSVVKRTKKLLDKSLRNNSAAPRNASLHSRVEALKRDTSSGDGTVVMVMATGKAIEKALSVACWFEQQSDLVVKISTRTVRTVDDVIAEDDDGFGAEDEARLRSVSCLEASISLK